MNKATIFLTACIASASLVAACGAPPSPQSPEQQQQAGEGPPGTPSASAAPGSSVVPPGSPVPGGPSTVPGVPMKPIATSAMATDLTNLGLDLKNLPALEKMEPNKLRKVMRTFTKALGAKCSDCHNESDYSAMTPMKKITLHMWNDYVRGLSLDSGEPLYCDTCHQGRMKFLDRHDKKALGAWMDENFVDKMKRRDGKEHKCATCHGEPFNEDILARWTK